MFDQSVTAIRRILWRAAFAATALLWAAPAFADCRSSIRNENCEVRIDRETPVSPLPLRVKPGAKVTITVTKRPLERIVFDVELADVAAPDPWAAIFTAFSAPLQAIVFGDRSVAPTPPPTPSATAPSFASDAVERIRAVEEELEKIDKQHVRIRAAAEAVDKKVEGVGTKLETLDEKTVGEWTQGSFKTARLQIWCAVSKVQPSAAVSSWTETCPSTPEGIGTMTLPVGDLTAAAKALSDAKKAFARLSEAEQRAESGNPKTSLFAKLNAVAWNQQQLEADLASLAKAQTALLDAAGVLAGIDAAKLVPSDKPASQKVVGPFDAHTNRTATVKISVKNLLTKEAKPLATVVVQWGGTRWEVSAGAIFSATPIRKFANTPIIENGTPATDDNGVLTVVTETQTRPMVVPAAFAHFNAKEGTVPDGQRLALLVTGAIGVNPYAGSADFAFGPTISYRGLMISPMLHRVREVRLTGGLKPGDRLGSEPPDLPTERHWVWKFGLGISYRFP
jgi:hypothetical protein